MRALAIQCLAFGLTLLLGWSVGLGTHGQLSFPVWMAALGQGAIAAVLSWRRLAPWWLAIQFAFPVALIGTLSLQLPPALFFAAFLFLLVLYWSSFRTQVPFYPSGRGTWDAVAKLLPQQRPIRLIDIGSGFGGLVLDLAARRPDSSFLGIELAPLPWLASALRARLAGSGAEFIRGDYEQLDFSGHDVVFAYLSPAAMPALWRKARAEMQSGALLLSYEFGIDGVAPDVVTEVGPKGLCLYGWRL